MLDKVSASDLSLSLPSLQGFYHRCVSYLGGTCKTNPHPKTGAPSVLYFPRMKETAWFYFWAPLCRQLRQGARPPDSGWDWNSCRKSSLFSSQILNRESAAARQTKETFLMVFQERYSKASLSKLLQSLRRFIVWNASFVTIFKLLGVFSSYSCFFPRADLS